MWAEIKKFLNHDLGLALSQRIDNTLDKVESKGNEIKSNTQSNASSIKSHITSKSTQINSHTDAKGNEILSALSSGRVVKKIQRGSFQHYGHVTYDDGPQIPIQAVNTSKSLIFLNYNTSGAYVSFDFVSSTVMRLKIDSGGDLIIDWQIIEFY